MFSPFTRRENQYWRIIVLCFLVASTFWVLNSLNKIYQNVRISYPVVFAYDSRKVIPVTEPPKEVTINVTAKGWKLLRQHMNLRIRPARIEIPANFRRNYLTNRELRPLVNAALHGFVLNYVVTDTLYFSFQPLVSRKLRLIPDSTQTLTATKYAVVGNVGLSPKQVTVSGPASLVNSLPDPYSVHIADSNLTRDYSGKVPLSFASQSLIKSNVKEIKAFFKVVPLQEGKAQVAVRLRVGSVLQKSPVATNPAAAEITYFFLPQSNPVNPSEILIEADLTRFNAADSTAPLVLNQKPEAVKMVSFSPKKVKILFSKPEPSKPE